MPFDSSLVLADDTADWTYANLVSSGYGIPTSTTRNSGGFAVLDLGEAPYTGLNITLFLTEAANASGDELTVTVEESTTEVFTVAHELGKFAVAGATDGVILGSETPCEVNLRVTPTRRYLRIKASCTASDDFKTVYCNASPFPFKRT